MLVADNLASGGGGVVLSRCSAKPLIAITALPEFEKSFTA